MKKESAAELYKQIWIIGYDNPLCPNTTVNEARTQEIQAKIRKSVNCITRTASQEGHIPTNENRSPFRKQKYESLALLIFLKEKRDELI